MKALELLKKNQSAAERADSIIKAVKRDVYTEYIDFLLRRKERLEDEILDLQNFNLNTNYNLGQVGMTKEDVKKRFDLLLAKEYELVLTNKELEYKGSIYQKYFDGPPVNDMPALANKTVEEFSAGNRLEDNK